MSVIPGMNLSFEQPIQMRFNELIAGVKSDIAIKIFGENLDVLFDQGNKTARLISGIEGLTDIKVEQVVGMPQLVVQYHRERIAQYGLNIDDVNRILNTALAGGKAGVIYEGERKYNLVVRLAQYRDADEEKLKNIFIPLPGGTQIPLSQLADIRFQSAPAQISREDAERRIVIEANVRGRDIEGVVHEIQSTLQKKLHLPAGYYLTYEGTFKNLQEARQRLQIAVPVALFLIFMLLFLSFRNLTESMIIFSAIPLAAIGGVIALWVRQMNFSISAGIGFIALFGVAVLNGIVLISQFNRLKEEGIHDSTQRILKGCSTRLRPVLATAAVASLGFLPMALSTSAGSEIQKPLATVVIGGLLSSTLLTLIILPILYSLFTSGHPINLKRRTIISAFVLTGFFMMGNSIPSLAQRSEIRTYSLDSVVAIALRNHPAIRSSEYSLEQNHTLKSKFLIEPMNMNWTLGQINSSVIDYNFTMSSGIKSIPEQRALFRIQEEQIALGRLQKQISEAEVKRDVTLAFIQTQFACLKVEVLDSLETLYEHFAHYANIKYKTGESALLEKMEAESLKKSIRLKQMEGWTARSVALHQLQEMMGQEDSLSIAFIPDFLLPLPTLEKKFVHQANPLFQYQMQQQNVYKAQYKVEKSKMFPTLQ
ncbi:MAG TPA: efflux RND transporter permease subunit, partial [Chitinophagaceae bacterium]|nr:efflux RND transporter permease subunit [Chitinophagaceae bacterium]